MSASLSVIAVVISVVLSLAAIGLYGFVRVCLAWREAALDQADCAVSQHFQALNELLADPAVPDSVAEFLWAISRRASDPQSADRVIKAMVERRHDSAEPEALAAVEALIQEVAELSRHRPDLARLFNEAVYFGLLGGGYRHLANQVSPIAVFRDMRLVRRLQAEQRAADTAPRAFAWAGYTDVCAA